MSSNNTEELKLHQNVMKGLVVDAVYQKTGIPHYDGHLGIEALPSIKSEDEFLESVIHLPDYKGDFRQLSNSQRGHHIQTLFHLYLPTKSLLHLEQMISIVLRKGLIARNPQHIQLWRSAAKNSEALRSMISREMVHYSRSTMLSIALIGISGSGKSTAIRTILSQYPQVILHREYEEKKFGFTQIVYLYIETPPDGSLKQLCLDILRSIDDILDTTYYKDYGKNGRITIHQLVGTIARVAALHIIGMLVIDEVQNLSAAKSGGAKTMMNFFVLLVNIVNLPVVLIGTPLIYETVGKEFRMGRRLAGQGDIIFNNFKEGPEWDDFVEAVWEYQYTRKVTILTSEIIQTFYYYSQGIIDILIKLYALAQMRAITSGTEEVTPSIIRTVFHDYFQSLRPAIEALRSGDISSMAAFPDIQPINIQAHIQDRLIHNHTLKVTSLLRKQKAKRDAINVPIGQASLRNTVVKSKKVGVQPTNSEVSNSSLIKSLALPQIKKLNLATIMKDGKKEGLDGYESLLNAGLVCSPMEILEYDE